MFILVVPLFFQVSLTETAAPNHDGHNSPTVRLDGGGDGDGCLATGTIDQRAEIRDGRWQRMLSGVPLRAKAMYEVVLAWDPTCAGCVESKI